VFHNIEKPEDCKLTFLIVTVL